MVHGGFDVANKCLLCPQFHSWWVPGVNMGFLLWSLKSPPIRIGRVPQALLPAANMVMPARNVAFGRP